MRRGGPAVQAADVPARPRRGPQAVVRHPSVMKGARNGSPPGALRSKPQNTARGTLRTERTCGCSDFDTPRRREASRPVGPSTLSLRTLRKLECARNPKRPARPRFFSRRADIVRAGYRAGPASGETRRRAYPAPRQRIRATACVRGSCDEAAPRLSLLFFLFFWASSETVHMRAGLSDAALHHCRSGRLSAS
jgi:hypothetical protein